MLFSARIYLSSVVALFFPPPPLPRSVLFELQSGPREGKAAAFIVAFQEPLMASRGFEPGSALSQYFWVRVDFH